SLFYTPLKSGAFLYFYPSKKWSFFKKGPHSKVETYSFFFPLKSGEPKKGSKNCSLTKFIYH
ncbi:MAG: hypothetical protein IKE90_04255, partial [Bacilli bacterium]|nr:hypothetical protein [Bacilli bacterium]